ncbi:Transcriptional regulator, GntR family domain / Aspartate aminotransferase [Alloalcanivorax xenomutans]|nr:MAG: PLP-dependent aminotransferase family protein [Alcanivorax sp.]CUR45726.1 Transcriptional regulator, GntR family domain / Aspartate aminotransferase [Alloalcanivorax xenomutans]
MPLGGAKTLIFGRWEEVKSARDEPWRPILKDGDKPIYIRIADAITDDILAGRLAVGERLPPLRDLAGLLSLNYATISKAYNEAQRRGLIYSRVGQGSFVCRPGGISRRGASADRAVDMTMNLPPESGNPLLRERMEAGLRALGPDLQPLMRYQEFGGCAEDRAAAVAWLQRRPLKVEEDRILVCPGVQSALLALLGSLARPGDVVLCEALTYPGLRAIAGQLGIRLVGLPLDSEGIDPDALVRLCAEHHPKALYCNPVLLNPAAVTLSEERRHRVVQIARRYNLPIIEDDAYGLLPTHPPPALAALAPELTYYLCGFSKSLGAGLRIAYLALPSARLKSRLAVTLRATTVMASPITAALASCWVQDGTADLAVSLTRKESRLRQALVNENLSGADYQTHPEAFHVWLRMPGAWSRVAFAARMRAQGINVVVSDAFAVNGKPPEAVRLCLGGPISRQELAHALHLIADTLDQPGAASAGFF